MTANRKVTCLNCGRVRYLKVAPTYKFSNSCSHCFKMFADRDMERLLQKAKKEVDFDDETSMP